MTPVIQFVGICLLGGWLWWCIVSSVTLYESTDFARIEAEQSAHAVQSEVAGRIRSWSFAPGADVHTGQIIAELDSTREAAQLAEMKSRAAGLKALSASVREQIGAEESAMLAEQDAARTAEDEARALSSRANAPAEYAEQESRRLKSLAAIGLISERELQRGILDAKEKRSEVDRRVLAERRIRQEQITHDQDRLARIGGLRAKLQETDAEAANTLASIVRVEAEIARLTVRAPVTGRVAEAAVLRPGSVLESGQRVGSILPASRNTVVAWFSPAAASGRIQPGQHATVRLHGYPWTQYGTVNATVSHVASELRDNKLRAELALRPPIPSGIPLQHGMPGSVEVEVERVSPLVLLGRHAGVMMTRPASSRQALP